MDIPEATFKLQPSDEILRLAREMHIIRELEMGLPVDDLLVGVVRALGTERRITDEAFEHDSAQ